ncbi:MAG: hypothetical protein AMK71_06630 [Nitrospira bacterium SG8_35_4]|nr:MAG: hypothetical protein AMK71_06630 [Nitrospira bacterium SG8_35_4]
MKRSIAVPVIILLLGVGGYFAYTSILKWHKQELEIATKHLRDELRLREGVVVSKEKLLEVFGEVLQEEDEVREIGFEDINRQVMAFFSYLDGREYIASHDLKNGTYSEFRQVLEKLSSNHPVIAGETDSLHVLYKNMSYFFRVLGLKRINLIKDILNNESEILESVAETFYLWFTIDYGIDEIRKERPSLQVLYNYSGYFLNTLAGKSYLLRRQPQVRLLTTYYCILVLDRANDLYLNPNGIDIRPHITSLITDITNQMGLMNKARYRAELERLNAKYEL